MHNKSILHSPKQTNVPQKVAQKTSFEIPKNENDRHTSLAEPFVAAPTAPDFQVEPFVDAVKAAEFLALRPRRILELARQRVIPAHPLGRGVRRVWRFRLSELSSTLCSSEVHCAHATVRAQRKEK